jgi:hypothetical protein
MFSSVLSYFLMSLFRIVDFDEFGVTLENAIVLVVGD